VGGFYKIFLIFAVLVSSSEAKNAPYEQKDPDKIVMIVKSDREIIYAYPAIFSYQCKKRNFTLQKLIQFVKDDYILWDSTVDKHYEFLHYDDQMADYAPWMYDCLYAYRDGCEIVRDSLFMDIEKTLNKATPKDVEAEQAIKKILDCISKIKKQSWYYYHYSDLIDAVKKYPYWENFGWMFPEVDVYSIETVCIRLLKVNESIERGGYIGAWVNPQDYNK
jgi:hypothetical protein